ncbi:MAG: plastocyanin/azurin family copper-binding protein [Dehalococcoidia bacterium]|nr:plastocyanin/azurin family copper-binding protein [Dehalococcoidia bacterium]MDZ4277990.1 plastocyanin/azurin family copper-binding protein [Dehalococcoidia bacterium]
MLRICAALLATLLFLALGSMEVDAGGGCRGEPVTDAGGTSVIMEGTCFTPTILRVQPGDTVTWMNASPEPHTVTGANAAWGDYYDVLEGQSASQRFADAGVYPYYCFLHPGMIGAVIVGDGSGAQVSAGGEGLAVQGVEPSRAAAEARTQASGRGNLSIIWVAGAVVPALAVAAGATGYMVGRRWVRAR